MSFKVKGKLLSIFAETTGTSPRGDWRKQDFLIETEDQYPKKLCLTLFNDKFNSLDKVKPEMQVEVSFNIESREFNQKWYTNLTAFKIEPAGNGSGAGDYPPPPSIDDLPPAPESDDKDDLPF